MTIYMSGRGPLTDEETTNGFMLFLEDDTEDAPWMVMGSLQWDATSDFFQSLREYVERHNLPWTVAGMHPIRYTWRGLPDLPGKKQLAPDVFVAFVPNRPRTSFDVEVEGGFPPFVLEVVSPSSTDRDEVEKRRAYDLLGVREYALFTPSADRPSRLEGHRRNAAGSFEPWPRDERGRLWSEVLGLYLLTQGTTIRAATPDGQLVPTLKEAVDLAGREAATREREAAAREQEAAARREAESEIERLRQEIERLRRQASATTESNDP